MVRLQKYLAEAGVASRRRCETLIAAGRVIVNGEKASLGQSIDSENDTVYLDGEIVRSVRKVYVLLHKPRGVITSVEDPQNRPTVFDCLSPEQYAESKSTQRRCARLNVRLFPVGRLDFDTQGALLLTNDGELTHRLIHPSFEIEKVYIADVLGAASADAVHNLERGVTLEDGLTAPAKVTIIKKGQRTTRLRLVLHEGRKHEVKRMCEAVGYPVVHLQRESFAGLNVRDMKPSSWRLLTIEEIKKLQLLAGLAKE